MFDHILKTAHESGGEVLVQLKSNCCEQYKGRILNLDSKHFTLFHSGPGGGVLWAFKRKDVAYCGLVVELPELSSLENSLEKLPINPPDIVCPDIVRTTQPPIREDGQ